MTSFVIDASVVLKWVVPEVGTEAALGLRRHRLLAPDLLVAECANAFWKKVRRKEMTAREALLAAQLLERADLELMPMRSLLAPAVELAVALGHSAYDCTYLALARTLACDLVTADEDFARRRLPAGFPSRVLGLGRLEAR